MSPVLQDSVVLCTARVLFMVTCSKQSVLQSGSAADPFSAMCHVTGPWSCSTAPCAESVDQNHRDQTEDRVLCVCGSEPQRPD